MAKKVIYQLIDDLDGTEIPEGEAETISFSLDGKDYEIDLNDKNATKLRTQFEQYVQAGTKVSKGAKSSKGSVQSVGRRHDLAQIREWAGENSILISGRGRISSDVISAYDAEKAGTLIEDDLRDLQQKFGK